VKVHHHYDDDDYSDYDDVRVPAERIRIASLDEPIVYKKLCQVRNIIVPYLQVYAAAFKALYELLPQQNSEGPLPTMFEITLRKKMLEKVLEASSVHHGIYILLLDFLNYYYYYWNFYKRYIMRTNQLIYYYLVWGISIPYSEVAVMETIKNFIVSMKNRGIIEEYVNPDSGRLMWSLLQEFSSAKSLNIALNNILSFTSF
jgi:hypothetical protein